MGGKGKRMAPAFDAKTYRTLLLFGFAMFIQATAYLSIVGVLPALKVAWGLPPQRAVLLVAAFGVTLAISAPVLQMLVGHWARRTQVLIGFSLLAAGCLGFAAAPGFPALVAARVGMGLGVGLLSPVVSAMATRLAGPRSQGPALALVSMGVSVAFVLGVPLSSWLGNLIGPRWLYLLLAALTAATAAAIALTVRDMAPGERVRPRDAAALLRRRATLSGLAVIFFLAGGVFATFAMIAPILRDEYGLTPRAVSAALFLYGFSGLAGNAVVRRASAVFRSETLLAAAGGVLIALFAAWLILPGSLAVLLPVLAAWPFVGDMLWPSQQRRMVELEAPFRGLALALSSSFMFTGMAFGSALGGRAYAMGGRSAVLGLTIALLSVGLASLGYSRRAARRSVPKPGAGEEPLAQAPASALGRSSGTPVPQAGTSALR
jgi:predicted MFS family arabinose efflux permease